jgi:hypothetical protein
VTSEYSWYWLVFKLPDGTETPRLARRTHGIPAERPPMEVGDEFTLPTGLKGEEFRRSGYWFVVDELRDDGNILVLRRIRAGSDCLSATQARDPRDF